MTFPAKYPYIIEQIDKINPIAYSKTRNYIDGSVTKLSPYISRGVISLPMVKEVILTKYSKHQSEKLLQELAWREYWQRVWEASGDAIFTSLRQPQTAVETNEIPCSIVNASTEIKGIDESIRQLYETGYMHNHCRMYVASVACNVAKAHWLEPSRWLYYHLLDGDLASNSLSWQWVAGSFSAKKYYCNQENIDKYCHTNQRGTFLDTSYDALLHLDIPELLQSRITIDFVTEMPPKIEPTINQQLPTLIYNSYNLDPLWHQDTLANRVLLLEPSHYKKFPVSKKVIDFIVALSTNIPDIQIYTGEFSELQQYTGDRRLIFKKHPAFTHYKGNGESFARMFPEVSGYFNSFFSYWKKCEKYL